MLRPLHQVTEHKFNHPNQASTTNNTNNNNNPTNNNNYKTTIVVPYISNTADKFKKLCKRGGIQVHFKGTNTLRTALDNPKDKDPKAHQTGVIYQYQCPHINCSSSYIGESGRSLGERVKEHLKAPSPIHLHSATSGHPLDPNQFNIVHKEVNSQSRTIKEAMFIHIQDPPQQEFGQVPAATHMGPALTCITNVPVQTNTTANHHSQLINPLLVPPFPPSTTTYLSHCPFRGGNLLFPIITPIGKYMHLSQTSPSPYLPLDLQQCHLGKFPYNIVSLTFPQ